MRTKRLLFIFLVGFISSLFLFTRLYDIKNRYSFEHDQEITADAAWKIIVEKQPILIGQETSTGGLFVGPFLWWFQSFILFLTNMNPIGLVYLGVIVSLLGLILIFLLINKIANKWQALIICYLYTVSPQLLNYDISSNALTYIIPFSIVVYWFVIEIINKKKYQILPLLSLTLAISFHIHFSLVLLIPAVIIIIYKYKSEIQPKYLIISIITFLLPLSTFLIFDLRHNFLLFNNFMKFSSQDSFSLSKIYSITGIFIDILVNSIFVSARFNYLIFFFLFLSIIYILKNKLKFLLNSFVLFFTPLIGFWFYSGHIPEYYFLSVVPIFLVLVSFGLYFLLKRNFIIFLIIILAITLLNFNSIKLSFHNYLPFSYKEKIIETVIKESKGEEFNVYYQMPRGLDKGYRYIFKWKQNIPKDFTNNIYILHYNELNQFNSFPYYKTYKSSLIKIQSIGKVYIISVKS